MESEGSQVLPRYCLLNVLLSRDVDRHQRREYLKSQTWLLYTKPEGQLLPTHFLQRLPRRGFTRVPLRAVGSGRRHPSSDPTLVAQTCVFTSDIIIQQGISAIWREMGYG